MVGKLFLWMALAVSGTVGTAALAFPDMVDRFRGGPAAALQQLRDEIVLCTQAVACMEGEVASFDVKIAVETERQATAQRKVEVGLLLLDSPRQCYRVGGRDVSAEELEGEVLSANREAKQAAALAVELATNKRSLLKSIGTAKLSLQACRRRLAALETAVRSTKERAGAAGLATTTNDLERRVVLLQYRLDYTANVASGMDGGVLENELELQGLRATRALNVAAGGR